ncbi:hypothetical protein B0H19DRAFT_1084905 [Mycena capillaripes]|nr:hypothetical protein B0H19DRAFT_1084905 [Mycena capillaripes]
MGVLQAWVTAMRSESRLNIALSGALPIDGLLQHPVKRPVRPAGLEILEDVELPPGARMSSGPNQLLPRRDGAKSVLFREIRRPSRVTEKLLGKVIRDQARERNGEPPEAAKRVL